MLTDDFLAWIAGVRRYSERTCEIYSDVLKEFMEFLSGYTADGSSCIGNAPATETLAKLLTVSVIRDYEYSLSEERKLSGRTVNQHLSVISSFCRWLMGQGLLRTNPVKLVSRPRCSKRMPVFFRKESMEEYFNASAPAADTESLQQLESAAGALHDGSPRSSSAWKFAAELYDRRLRRMIVSMLFETGMRRAEMISLKIGSVDYGRSIIKVHGKGDKMREIPMTSALSEEISLYLKAAETIAGRERAAAEPLLITLGGAELYPVFVDRAVKRELGQVDGITGRKSPHVLRHTLATELLNDGSDLYSIKEMLGHSSLAATQVYTHNTIEKLKKVYTNAHPRAKRGGKNGD